MAGSGIGPRLAQRRRRRAPGTGSRSRGVETDQIEIEALVAQPSRFLNQGAEVRR
jgi:hypothetical protein